MRIARACPLPKAIRVPGENRVLTPEEQQARVRGDDPQQKPEAQETRAASRKKGSKNK